MLDIGTFRRPHGLQGEIALARSSRESVFPYRRLFVRGREMKVTDARPMASRRDAVWLLHLEGITDRTQASTLTGAVAQVPREDLPPPPDGGYYLCDLPGMAVVDESSALLGIVADVVEHGAADHLELAGGDLIPIEPFVIAVDREARRITVRLPEGLLSRPGRP